MKCNVRELAHLSDLPCVVEGRLNYKKITSGGYRNQQVFKERWFRLINNYLFYFKISEMGKFDTKNPAGVFVMENTSIQMEDGNLPFSFSVSFIDEPEKRHIFSARSEENVVNWVKKLRECSYEFMRLQLHFLQSKIFKITGKDPLLLVPRNDGACLWSPAMPFSAASACSGQAGAFNCHLHAAAFTLERSKSDVQTRRQKHTTRTSQVNSNQAFALERIKSAAVIDGISCDTAHGSARFTRRAPSPPARVREHSAARHRDSRNACLYDETNNHLEVTGILEQTPVAPKRKLSPRLMNASNVSIEVTQNNTQETRPEEEDLIKF